MLSLPPRKLLFYCFFGFLGGFLAAIVCSPLGWCTYEYVTKY